MWHVVALVLLQATPPEIRYFSLKDPNPEPSIAWFILNAFFFIAVALTITVALGIAFGSFRYWLLTKFPYNKLNGADKDDLAQTFRLND